MAATFGSGLAAACVVDVGNKRGIFFQNHERFNITGDQKISVSCVEDGVSQPNTRLQLGYGDHNNNRGLHDEDDDVQAALM